MKVLLTKQAAKYIAKADTPTQKKLYKALERLASLDGDIKKLKGETNLYRYKIEHYRIIFERVQEKLLIRVIEINTRGNIYK